MEESEEVLGSVDRDLTGIDDMPENPVDGTNDQLLQFVKGDRVLSFVQGRGTKENEDGFDAHHYSAFNANNIKEVNINSIMDIDVIGCGDK
jgi:hypothetical protein